MAKYSRFRSRVALPLNHSERDAEWLEGVLLRLSPAHQLKACMAYSDAFNDAYEAETVEHKKENAARRTANNRIRKFRDACLDAYMVSAQESIDSAHGSVGGFSGF